MRQKEEAAAQNRHNFEWLQQLRREGFRKVRTHTAASTHGQTPCGCCRHRPAAPHVRAHLSLHLNAHSLTAVVMPFLLCWCWFVHEAPRHAGSA